MDSFRKCLCVVVSLLLAGCMTKWEAQDHFNGMADARLAPKAVAMDYLQCYTKVKKRHCIRRMTSELPKSRLESDSHFYNKAFDAEMERLGFLYFLNEQGKTCIGMDRSPYFWKKKRAYVVNCKDGNRYLMRFNKENKAWSVLSTLPKQKKSG